MYTKKTHQDLVPGACIRIASHSRGSLSPIRLYSYDQQSQDFDVSLVLKKPSVVGLLLVPRQTFTSASDADEIAYYSYDMSLVLVEGHVYWVEVENVSPVNFNI